MPNAEHTKRSLLLDNTSTLVGSMQEPSGNSTISGRAAETDQVECRSINSTNAHTLDNKCHIDGNISEEAGVNVHVS